MREIKFRAWLKPTKQMAKVTGIDLERSGTFRVLTPDNQTIWFGQVNISAIVMQFTGLLDKKGKEIYEGDILDCTDRITFVHWNEFCGTWDCKFIRYKSTLCSNGAPPVEWKYRAEIIGNRFENPELLEEETE